MRRRRELCKVGAINFELSIVLVLMALLGVSSMHGWGSGMERAIAATNEAPGVRSVATTSMQAAGFDEAARLATELGRRALAGESISASDLSKLFVDDPFEPVAMDGARWAAGPSRPIFSDPALSWLHWDLGASETLDPRVANALPEAFMGLKNRRSPLLPKIVPADKPFPSPAAGALFEDAAVGRRVVLTNHIASQEGFEALANGDIAVALSMNRRALMRNIEDARTLMRLRDADLDVTGSDLVAVRREIASALDNELSTAPIRRWVLKDAAEAEEFASQRHSYFARHHSGLPKFEGVREGLSKYLRSMGYRNEAGQVSHGASPIRVDVVDFNQLFDDWPARFGTVTIPDWDNHRIYVNAAAPEGLTYSEDIARFIRIEQTR